MEAEVDNEPPTLTVGETAKLLRQGINQTYGAVRAGEIPAIRIGKRWHVLAGPLKRMLSGGA
jgi:excisionase family DNA binding protein